MEKRMLIIGAGVGGLATGIYARLNGYPARIFEMHSAPGGVCTAWSRKGYTFDGCIHNLAGTAISSPFHAMWRELGVSQPMHAYRELVSVERPDGDPFCVHARLDVLQTQMKDMFPQDTHEIDKLIRAARRMQRVDILGLALSSPFERLKAAFALAGVGGIANMTMERYAQRFRHPFLRSAFPRIVYDWPGQSMAMLLHFLASLDKGDLGWPMGGSATLAHGMETRFRELGGELVYQRRVASIIVEQDTAVGVRFDDGSEERADIIVSNAYGPATIFGMLEGRYADERIRRHYEKPEDRVEMGVHISLGVARDLSAEPHAIIWPLPSPTEIDGELRERLYIQTFGFDPSMAPPGKGVIKVLLSARWTRWRALAADPQAYKREQDEIAKKIISLLEHRFSSLSQQVEVVDVATPLTTERFTGNGPGYPLSRSSFASTLLLGRRLTQTLPGLRNFYMVGQWAGLPGVPMVAAMGRDIVRDICKSQHRSFISGQVA
jgi:phytoene dehydrogenase-like protein